MGYKKPDDCSIILQATYEYNSGADGLFYQDINQLKSISIYWLKSEDLIRQDEKRSARFQFVSQKRARYRAEKY